MAIQLNRTNLEQIISNWDKYDLEFKILFVKKTWEIYNLLIEKWLYIDVYRKNCKNNWGVEKEFIGDDPNRPAIIQLNNLLYRFLIDFNNLETAMKK